MRGAIEEPLAARMAVVPWSLPGVSIIHNYFQSCHGKGPSDSEGAAVKNHYRHVEHQQRRELNTTGELVAECRGYMQIDRLGSL